MFDIHVASSKSKPCPKPGSITLINYDICFNLKQNLQLTNQQHQQQYQVLICDEAHYLKSPDSKRTKAILGNCYLKKGERVADPEDNGIQSEYLWLLTGTPVLNRPVELFPLVCSIAPEEFSSFEDYASRYCDPKPKTVISRYGRPIQITDYSGSSNLEELSNRLESIMLRRYKGEVLSQLPPKFRSCTCLTTDLDIAKQERELLKASLQDHFNATTDIDLEYFCKNSDKLMSYIQARSDNEMMAKISAVRQETAFLKLKPSIELLEEYISQEKVVVFAHHRAVIDAVMKHFGRRAVGIMGGMKRETRDEAVRKFQDDPDVRLFVGSIRAAGIGLTLTAASHVVFLELDWSPGVMAQAEDRCHRVGQVDSVRVQYFVFKDTIDEWLSKSLLFKQNTINEILPEKTGGTDTGYVFNFGKHKGIRLEDAPRRYIDYLLSREIWRGRPDLWRALALMGLVSEEPPPLLEHETAQPTITYTTDNQDEQETKMTLPVPTLKNEVSSRKLQGTGTGYVLDFGKHAGTSLAEVPDSYVQFLLDKEVWKQRSDLKRELRAMGLVSSQEAPNFAQEAPNFAQVQESISIPQLNTFVFDFGKYSGKRWDETPENYRGWILRKKVWKSLGGKQLKEALQEAGYFDD